MFNWVELIASWIESLLSGLQANLQMVGDFSCLPDLAVTCLWTQILNLINQTSISSDEAKNCMLKCSNITLATLDPMNPMFMSNWGAISVEICVTCFTQQAVSHEGSLSAESALLCCASIITPANDAICVLKPLQETQYSDRKDQVSNWKPLGCS